MEGMEQQEKKQRRERKRKRKRWGRQKDRRQVHKLSGDEKTTEEQLNNATSPHSNILYRPPSLPGVPTVSYCRIFNTLTANIVVILLLNLFIYLFFKYFPVMLLRLKC